MTLPAPNLLAPNRANLPKELIAIPQWCAWTLAKNKSAKAIKPAIDIATGRFARVDEPSNWHSFEEAWAYYESHKNSKPQIYGVGFLVSEPIIGIDFDHCVNGKTISEWALPFIQELCSISYTELSPSGHGIRAFIKGTKTVAICKRPGLGPDKTGAIEVYDQGRYLTLTGHRLKSCKPTIAEGEQAQRVIDRLLTFMNDKPKDAPSFPVLTISINTERESTGNVELDNDQYVRNLSDSELLHKARRARGHSGPNFRRLFDDYVPQKNVSQNEDDLSLCRMLAYWTRNDAARIDRLFRQSAMMRVKWDEIHTADKRTYGQTTIEKAIAASDNVYAPIKAKRAKAQKKTPKEPKEPASNTSLPMAEDDLAVRFVAKHKDNMRYCHTEECWYGWNGQIWKKEDMKQSLELVRKICKEAAELAGIKERKGLLRRQLYRNVAGIAQNDEAMRVTHEIWDANIYLLGTPHGTVDLKTGELRQANTLDYITKSTLVAPENGIPQRWLQFLEETTAGDKELQRFIQQICGMALTGDTSEDILIFIYGPGGNGKSVFLTVLTEILADYSKTTPIETFTVKNLDQHPTEIAMLQGARLVTASETDEGKRWAESRIKNLTGGDKITARYLYQDFFTYKPQFKILIIGNHKPAIRNLDDAIQRRFNLIPFNQKPTQVDTHLREKLRAEYPQILSWMIEGCLDWQKNGLQRPNSVKEATEEYFADQDIFSQWIAECCNVDPIFTGKSSALFASWKEFAEQNGIRPGNSTTFKEIMVNKRHFERKHTNTAWIYLGICLKPKDDEVNRYSD